MKPEEEFNNNVWYVLKKIKAENLATTKGVLIEYVFNNVLAAGYPSQREEEQILRKLAEWKALNIKDDNPFDIYASSSWHWYLKIFQPKFDEIYIKYQKLCDVSTILNDYQEKKFEESRNNTKKKSQEINVYEQIAIDFTKDKSDWFIPRLWQVVYWLEKEREAIGKNTIKIPLNQFKKKKIDHEEARKFCTNMESSKIISVFKELEKTPSSDNPDKLMLAVGKGLNDDESIFYDLKTTITLNHPFKYLYEILEARQLAIKGKDTHSENDIDQNKEITKETAHEAYPVILVLKGDAFCISGKELNGINYHMQSITEAGSGAYIDPLLKVCKISPSRFKIITAEDLKTKSVMKDNALDNALTKVSLFKRYLSNLGLKGELRDLFYANSPSGLFKFRTAVPKEEWDKFLKEKRQKLVNSIRKFRVLET